MRTISMSEHNIFPGDDRTLTQRLNRLLEELRSEKSITLQFAPGCYHFYPDNAPRKMMYISNHDEDAVKSMAFNLTGFDALAIDGGGASFIFHTELLPFYLEQCTQVRLQNFTVDYSRPVYSQAKICAVSAQEMEVEIDDLQYPFEVCDGQLYFTGENFRHRLALWLEMDADTSAPMEGTEDLYFTEHPGREPGVALKAEQISKTRVRFTLQGKDRFFAASRVGNSLILRHHPRSHPCFYASDCTDVQLHGIDVYHAAGIAFLAERCKDIALHAFNVCVNPTHPRIFTAMADATHFVNCEGQIHLANCLFENQLDDALNAHGIYGVVESRTQEHAVVFRLIHEMQLGVYIGRPGQQISFLDSETLQPILTTTIEAIERLSPTNFSLRVQDALPESIQAGCIVENTTQKPHVLIEHCTFRRNRARGILLTCKQAVVHDCQFESAGAAVLLEGDTSYWFESGSVSSVELFHNEFIHCAYIPAWGNAPIQVTPSAKCQPPHYYHGRLYVHDNYFCLDDERLLYARNIRDIDFADNRIAFSPDRAPAESVHFDVAQAGSVQYSALPGGVPMHR